MATGDGIAQGLRIVDVLGHINSGGFGRVDRVRLSDGTEAARKCFEPSAMLDELSDAAREKLRLRFEKEVRLQSELALPCGTLPVLVFGLHDSPPWYVMPLADKTYEAQLVEDRAAGQVRAEPLLDMLAGLEELHRLGYVHRDLKPSNVLLHQGTWKLADFGLAVAVGAGKTARLTSTGSIWGSPLYMAPEQVKGLRYATPQSDIYAFGCVLHDLVDGKRRIPYQVQTVKGRLDGIVRRCTALDPSKRFKSVAALRDALVDVLKKETPLERPADVPDEWQHLADVETWSADRVAAFATYLEAAPAGEETGIACRLTDEALKTMATRAPDEWEHLGLAYCEWALGTFTFSLCDVIVGRLEWILKWTASSMELRAAAIASAARMGASHNRFFVMRRLVGMADKRLDDDLAERVAIEIRAQELQEAFRSCVDQIGFERGLYHPAIARAIADPEGRPIASETAIVAAAAETAERPKARPDRGRRPRTTLTGRRRKSAR